MAVAEYKNPFADVDEYVDPFADVDAPQPLGNPTRANETLNNGLLYTATPEDIAVIRSNLTGDDYEKEVYKAYNEQKHGIKFNTPMLEAQRDFEYPDGSYGTANQFNKKAATKQKEITFSAVKESFVRRTAGGAAGVAPLMADYAKLRTKLATEVGEKLGMGALSGFIEHLMPTSPLDVAAGVSRLGEAVKPEAFDAMRKWGKEELDRAMEIQSAHMSGVPLEESIAKGDLKTASKDIGTAIAFEMPNLVTQMTIGRFMPNASIGYMMAISAGAKMADIEDDASLEERVIRPFAAAAIEGATEKYIGTGRIVDNMAKNRMTTGLVEFLKRTGTDAVGGAMSEGGATFGENVMDKAYGDDVSLKEGVLLSAIVGSVMDAGAGSLQPMTLGDARRARQQMTNEEIDELDVAPEDKTAMKNPTEATVQIANDAKVAEEAFAEEASEVGAKVFETDKKPSKPAPAQDETLYHGGVLVDGKPVDKLSLDFQRDDDVGNQYGKGIYLTTKQESAEAYAGSRKDGHVYSIKLNPDATLKDIDMVLSGDMYIKAMRQLFGDKWTDAELLAGHEKIPMTIGTLYREASRVLGSPDKAQEFLKSFGIDGLRIDNENAAVVFDDKNVSIVKPSDEQQAKPAQEPVSEEKAPQIEREEVSVEDEIVTTKTASDGDTIGISRKQSNILKEARNQVLSVAPETRIQPGVIEEASKVYDAGKITSRVDEILSVKGARAIPITDKEVAQSLIRKTELAVEAEELLSKRDKAEKDGDMELFHELDDELEGIYRADLRLTKATETSISENARGMAMMGRIMDKKSFKLVDVVRNATTAKKDVLTKEERASVENFAKELKATQDISIELGKDATKAEEAMLKELADGAVEEMLSTMQTRRTKEQIKAKHKQLQKKLPSLAARANDITGITVETAKAITELAMNYIHDGATTLNQVKTLFLEQTDGFTEQDFYQALGGRNQKAIETAKSDAQLIMTEVKAQARLHDEIMDAVNGIFDPANPVKKTSAEIKDLRTNLKLWKASVVRTERDDQRVEAIFDTIDSINDMIDLKYRPIKVVNKKSKDLIEAEKMLITPRAELAAQDVIAVLEEVLRTDVPIKKNQADRGETSQRLEEFRARIVVLKELIIEKNAPKKRQEAYKAREKILDAKIAELTEEVEKFIRTVVPKKETREEMVARKATKAELIDAKRDQDALADLFDIIRNKRVPDGKPKTESKKDPYGYKAMIQNVRNEMQASEWFSEWKQTRDEANKLTKSQDNIADMEQRLKNDDFEGFITSKQIADVKNEKLIKSRIKEQRLKREINERIRALKKKTKADWAREILNIPRSAKLTFDMGHIWRQAGIVLSGPSVSAREMTKISIDAFLSQEKSDALDLWVISHPDYEKAVLAGVKMNDAGENLSEGRERLLHSDLLEQVPAYGKVVKMSARSQLVGLNVIRLTWFSNYMKNNPDQSPEQLKQAAKVLNVMTGYADLTPDIGKVAPFFDNFMTSFRFSWSRAEVHALLPYSIAQKNKALTKQLSKDLAAFYAVRAGIMATAAYLFPQIFDIGGFDDDDKYKESLNGKLIVKVGNGYVRVYDPWSGIAQATSAIGGVLKGDENALKGLADYMSTKSSPQLQLAYSLWTGKDWRGKEIVEGHPILSRTKALAMGMLPITIEGIGESIAKDSGVVDLLAGTITDFVGVGSYLIKEEDAKK